MARRESHMLTGMGTGVAAVFTALAVDWWAGDDVPSAVVFLLFALLVGPVVQLANGLLRGALSSAAIDLLVVSLFYVPAGLSLRTNGAPMALVTAYLAIPVIGLLCAAATGVQGARARERAPEAPQEPSGTVPKGS